MGTPTEDVAIAYGLVPDPNKPLTMEIYLDDGRVATYEVADATKAREHAHAIVQKGFRSAEANLFEYYPPHRIEKVKVIGHIPTAYPTAWRGT